MNKWCLIPLLLCLGGCMPLPMSTSSNEFLGEIDYDYLEKRIILGNTTNREILQCFGKPNMVIQYSDLRRSFQYNFYKHINKYGYSNLKSSLKEMFIGDGGNTGIETKIFTVVFTPDNTVESFTLHTDHIDYENQDADDLQAAKLKYTNHYYSGVLDRKKILASLIPGQTTQTQILRLPELGQPDMVMDHGWLYSFAPVQNKVVHSEIAAQVPLVMLAGGALFSMPTSLILEFDENNILISRAFLDPGDLTEEEKSILADSSMSPSISK